MKDLIEEVYRSDEQIDILKKIIQIPSENPGNYEEELAKKIASILENEGITTSLKYVEDKRPNIYAVLEGEKVGKTLLYNGHMDTVPVGGGWIYNPFGAYEDASGTIYGRGAADMKAGLASMIYATICLKRLGYPKKGRLLLFLNVDEEMTNKGMEQFLSENIRADYAIISEPSNMDINIGHRGSARYRITTKGTSGHAAFVKEPDNAIEKMNKVLASLFEYSKEIKAEKKHDFLGGASSHVTMIKGGTIANMIPDQCRITIDRRVLPGETRDSIEKDYVDMLTEKNVNVTYELETISFLPSSMIDMDHELVKTVHKIAREKRPDVKVKEFEATCEAAYFSVYKNIPTIIYGPGSLQQAHVVDEYVSRDQVIEAGRNFILICMEILK